LRKSVCQASLKCLGGIIGQEIQVSGWHLAKDEFFHRGEITWAIQLSFMPRTLILRFYQCSQTSQVLMLTKKYVQPLPEASVGWFMIRAFTTSAGVPMMAPTSLETSFEQFGF
jgi:hypothetical protein